MNELPPSETGGAESATANCEPSARPLVLLAEDSPTQAAWIAAVLREAGYEVSIAADGQQALECARRLLPAVIVSDVDMPGLDGFELCRTVKVDPTLRGIPFLVVTHRDRASDIIRALEVGADNYLTKPIDAGQVVVRIDRILSDVRNWRARAAGGRSRPLIEPGDVVLSLERSQVTELLMATAEKLEEEIAALGELGARLTMVQEPAELLDFATRRTRELAEADVAWIALVENDEWHVRAVADTQPARAAQLQRSTTLADDFALDIAALRGRTPFHIRHPEKRGAAARAGRRCGIVQTYGWPLVVDSQLIGVLAICYSGPRALTASERRRFVHIADQTAVGVENSRRFERERQLRNRLEEAYAAEKAAHKNALFILAAAVEARDGLTGAHLRRVGAYAQLLAEELGLDRAFTEEIGYSSMLHDVGKLLVPDAVLGKPGPLSDDEWVEMRRHPGHAVQILGNQPFFEMAREIAASHHERWDGTGYPDRLRGDEIPIAARITSVADVFDALTTRRHYKEAWPSERAFAEILSLDGKSFDPAVVSAFIRLYERGEIERIRLAVASEEPLSDDTPVLDRVPMPDRPFSSSNQAS